MSEGFSQDHEHASQAERRPVELEFTGSRQRDVSASAELVTAFAAVLDSDPDWRAGVEERTRALAESYERFEGWLAVNRPEPEPESEKTGEFSLLVSDIRKAIRLPKRLGGAALRKGREMLSSGRAEEGPPEQPA